MSRKEFSEGKQSMMQISPLYPRNPRMCLSACLCLLFALILSCALCSLLSFHSSFQKTQTESIEAMDGALCWFTLMTRQTWLLHPRM